MVPSPAITKEQERVYSKKQMVRSPSEHNNLERYYVNKYPTKAKNQPNSLNFCGWHPSRCWIFLGIAESVSGMASSRNNVCFRALGHVSSGCGRSCLRRKAVRAGNNFPTCCRAFLTSSMVRQYQHKESKTKRTDPGWVVSIACNYADVLCLCKREIIKTKDKYRNTK